MGKIRVDRQSTFLTILPGIAFKVGQPYISTDEVEVGKEIVVSAEVVNIGEVEGTQIIALEVNGEVISTQRVFLEVGQSCVVDFVIAEDTPGVCLVAVGGQEMSFKVLRPAAFEVSNLTVNPTEAKVGEEITISAEVEKKESEWQRWHIIETSNLEALEKSLEKGGYQVEHDERKEVEHDRA